MSIDTAEVKSFSFREDGTVVVTFIDRPALRLLWKQFVKLEVI